MTINTFRLSAFFGGFFICLALAAAPPVSAYQLPTTPAVADAPALDGLWKGQLKVPGGQLDVIFRFMKLSGGEYFCSLDVPMQKVSRMNVKMEVKADTVLLFAEESNSRFVGKLSADSKQINGIWQQPGFKTPMVLNFSPLPDMSAKNVRLTPPYREEEATFTNLTANARLSGMLTIPAVRGRFQPWCSSAMPARRTATAPWATSPPWACSPIF
ncbi:hypothetical protein BEN47_08130 [Hymenobacter lapidarius]|uniref:Uncharacterized protein n=1 Tax=Hymenobacter lapidarius TaxID=1908237 RepID=A0A1G1TDY7_9BACT|nr:hypothetical protein [Hymenobacter lapidarius]OGX89085.1 hypothetical protein BEN47_08130 [Hymenobacter lapidarius]